MSAGPEAEGQPGPNDPSGSGSRNVELRSPRAATRRDVRAALALGGPVLFTPPVLALADREAAVLGIPTVVLYVLGAWLAGIVLTFLASRGSGGERP